MPICVLCPLRNGYVPIDGNCADIYPVDRGEVASIQPAYKSDKKCTYFVDTGFKSKSGTLGGVICSYKK
jgi:hypothetical protein